MALVILIVVFGVILPQVIDYEVVWDTITSLSAHDLLVLLAVRAIGASTVFVTEPSAARRKKAEESVLWTPSFVASYEHQDMKRPNTVVRTGVLVHLLAGSITRPVVDEDELPVDPRTVEGLSHPFHERVETTDLVVDGHHDRQVR